MNKVCCNCKHNIRTGEVSDVWELIINAPPVDIKPFALVSFSKEELNRIVEERVIEPIKNGELVIKEERPQGEWIPVSVQAPDVGGMYLVTAKAIGGYIGTDIARRVSDDVWTFGGEELSGTEIIAWMPLPEAYKEADNENSTRTH